MGRRRRVILPSSAWLASFEVRALDRHSQRSTWNVRRKEILLMRSTRRVLATLITVVGLSALTSACDLFEDGSYRTEDGVSGCLIPDLGCTGPLIDVIKLGPPPVPTCEVSLFEDTWTDGECPIHDDDTYVIQHDYIEEGDRADLYDICRAAGSTVYLKGNSVLCG